VPGAISAYPPFEVSTTELLEFQRRVAPSAFIDSALCCGCLCSSASACNGDLLSKISTHVQRSCFVNLSVQMTHGLG